MTQGKQFINETLTKIQDTTSNPAPLGLLGFGMTTVLLNIHNAGFYAFNTMILGMGVCLRRHCPGDCRHSGMEKRQYLRRDGLHFLWSFLAFPGSAIDDFRVQRPIKRRPPAISLCGVFSPW